MAAAEDAAAHGDVRGVCTCHDGWRHLAGDTWICYKDEGRAMVAATQHVARLNSQVHRLAGNERPAPVPVEVIAYTGVCACGSVRVQSAALPCICVGYICYCDRENACWASQVKLPPTRAGLMIGPYP